MRRLALREALSAGTRPTPASSEYPVADPGAGIATLNPLELKDAESQRLPSRAASPYLAAFSRLRSRMPPEQDETSTRQLLDRFLARATARIQRLGQLVAVNETDGVRREAHGLRDSLNLVGLSAECERCTELMALTLPGDRQQALLCVGQIERCLSSLGASRQTPAPAAEAEPTDDVRAS